MRYHSLLSASSIRGPENPLDYFTFYKPFMDYKNLTENYMRQNPHRSVKFIIPEMMRKQSEFCDI